MEEQYFEESELIQKMQEENHDMLWYIEHHSEELREEYAEFCEANEVSSSSLSSAISFMEYHDAYALEFM